MNEIDRTKHFRVNGVLENIYTTLQLFMNVGEYLEQCLNSLVNQTLDGIQVIMVNDGSSDNTPQIMDEHADKYENFQVIH